MKGLRLENTQGRLKSGMPGSISETRGRFCDGLGSNIVVQYSVGPIITLRGRVTARDFVDVISEQRCSFPKRKCPIHTAGTVQLWFEKHEGEHLPWLAQSPDLYNIEPLLSIFETRVRNRLPRPSSLEQLEDVLQEEWYKIPLETV
jgi:hypothetical protein